MAEFGDHLSRPSPGVPSHQSLDSGNKSRGESQACPRIEGAAPCSGVPPEPNETGEGGWWISKGRDWCDQSKEVREAGAANQKLFSQEFTYCS